MRRAGSVGSNGNTRSPCGALKKQNLVVYRPPIPSCVLISGAARQQLALHSPSARRARPARVESGNSGLSGRRRATSLAPVSWVGLCGAKSPVRNGWAACPEFKPISGSGSISTCLHRSCLVLFQDPSTQFSKKKSRMHEVLNKIYL